VVGDLLLSAVHIALDTVDSGLRDVEQVPAFETVEQAEV
jgi:hypothetical protein